MGDVLLMLLRPPHDCGHAKPFSLFARNSSIVLANANRVRRWEKFMPLAIVRGCRAR